MNLLKEKIFVPMLKMKSLHLFSKSQILFRIISGDVRYGMIIINNTLLPT